MQSVEYSSKTTYRIKDFMQILGLSYTIDKLAMASSVHKFWHVLRGEWSCLEDIGALG